MNSMKSREIPVVIVHFCGQQDYLRFALKSAADFNNIVVLIGDETNKNFWNNHWDTTLIKFDKYQKFQKYYVHKSYISEEYEKFCLKRAFVLEKWMKESGCKQVFLLDSDVITFANYSEEVYPLLPDDCIASLMTSENQDNFRWASSPNFSYWTIKALENYTNFCIEAYSNKKILDQLEAKWQWHLDNNQPGGVCEMTLLYLWSKDNPQVANFTRVINDMTVDYNINDADNYFENEYQMQFGIKKFIFKNGVPYGDNKILKKEIKFLCIHCQGNGKYLMRYIYYKPLRNLYYLRQLLLIINFQTKLLIEKIISNKLIVLK